MRAQSIFLPPDFMWQMCCNPVLINCNSVAFHLLFAMHQSRFTQSLLADVQSMPSRFTI